MHCIANSRLILRSHQRLGNFLLLPVRNQQFFPGNFWLSFETRQCVKILVKWDLDFNTSGIPFGMRAETSYCSNQTPSTVDGYQFVGLFRQCSIIPWVGEHAFSQDCTMQVPAFSSASMHGAVRFGMDSCASDE